MSKALITIGLLCAAYFFLLAPRSPVKMWIELYLSDEMTYMMAVSAGVVGLVSFVVGVLLYYYEIKPKYVANVIA